MTAWTRSAIAMFTDFCTADDLEATARRPGFVKRTSKIPGTLFLALVTVGSWSDAHTTFAPWAAKVTQVLEQVDVSPAAIAQRMTKRALVFLPEMIRQALAKVQALDHGCADGLFTAFPTVSLADSRGLGLPDS